MSDKSMLGETACASLTTARRVSTALTVLMSSAVDFPARTLAQPAGTPVLVESNPASGHSFVGSFANYDPVTSSWKTAQTSWLTASGWTSLSGSWPQSGMTRNGIAYPLPPLVPRISASASSLLPTLDRPNVGRGIPQGSELRGRTVTVTDRKTGQRRKVQVSLKNALALFPTLTAKDGSGRGYQYQGSKDRIALTLSGHVRMLPTLIARDRRTYLGAKRMPHLLGSEPLTVALGGTLNPRWCEWFMGYPQAWCVVASGTVSKLARSATRSSRKSRNGSRGKSSKPK